MAALCGVVEVSDEGPIVTVLPNIISAGDVNDWFVDRAVLRGETWAIAHALSGLNLRTWPEQAKTEKLTVWEARLSTLGRAECRTELKEVVRFANGQSAWWSEAHLAAVEATVYPIIQSPSTLAIWVDENCTIINPEYWRCISLECRPPFSHIGSLFEVEAKELWLSLWVQPKCRIRRWRSPEEQEEIDEAAPPFYEVEIYPQRQRNSAGALKKLRRKVGQIYARFTSQNTKD